MGKYKSDTEMEVYRFIKILIGVIIVVLGAYFIANKIDSKNKGSAKQSNEVEISSTKIIVGSILNRPYNTYYVLAYKSKDNSSVVYETLLSMYQSKEKALKVYVVDLDNRLNENYYSEEGNPKATKIQDLKISSPTLIKVTDKKISKYVEGQESIKKELGL